MTRYQAVWQGITCVTWRWKRHTWGRWK